MALTMAMTVCLLAELILLSFTKKTPYHLVGVLLDVWYAVAVVVRITEVRDVVSVIV